MIVIMCIAMALFEQLRFNIAKNKAILRPLIDGITSCKVNVAAYGEITLVFATTNLQLSRLTDYRKYLLK